MNTFEFFQRLMRPLSVNSIEALSADDGLELVDALNASLQMFYRLAPDRNKRKSISYYLPAPRTVDITVFNGSKQIMAGLHGEDGQVIRTEEERVLELDGVILVQGDSVGCSIRIEGDANWNRVDGENLLRDAYQGESGLRTATIYSDVIALDGASIESLANDPVLDTGDVLVHDDALRQYGTSCDADMHKLGYRNRSSADRRTGRPESYYIGHTGDQTFGQLNLQGLVMLDPVPLVAHNVNFDAFWRPLRFTMASLLQAPVVLPLADDLMETILIPLALDQLTMSSLWKDPKMVDRVSQRAADARALISDLPQYVAVPNNQCSTPAGF